MLGDGDPRTTISGTRTFDTRAVSGTLGAVVVIGIGIALVAFSATMLSGMAETTGQQPRAATDVELGPGGVVVELEAVGDADSVRIQRNGELIHELVDPQAGIQTVIEASNVSAGDTITVVGEADGNRVVLDSVTVDDRSAAAMDDGANAVASDDTSVPDVPADINGDVSMPFDGSDEEIEATGDTTDGSSSSDERDDSTDENESDRLRLSWTVDDIDTRSLQVEDSGPLLAGTRAGSVTEIDRADGTANWSTSVGDGPVVGVTQGDTDTVYAGSDGGTIHRIDDGAANWSVDVASTLDADPEADVTDLDHGAGSTYTAVTAVNDTTASAVARVDADGTVQWTSTADSNEVSALDASSDGGAVVAETDQTSSEHRVRRVEEDGTTSTETSLPREPTALLTVDGQTTVALAANETASSSVWQLADDGTPAWQYETDPDANVTAMAAADGRTYVAVGDENGTVVALDETGSPVWQDALSNETDGTETPSVTSLSVGPDGDLYASTPDLTRFAIEE